MFISDQIVQSFPIRALGDTLSGVTFSCVSADAWINSGSKSLQVLSDLPFLCCTTPGIVAGVVSPFVLVGQCPALVPDVLFIY